MSAKTLARHEGKSVSIVLPAVGSDAPTPIPPSLSKEGSTLSQGLSANKDMDPSRLTTAEKARAWARKNASADKNLPIQIDSVTSKVRREGPERIGGGMATFSLSKGQISRAVVKFADKPNQSPLAVCFHFPNTYLTHRHVMDLMRSHLRTFTHGAAEISAIQFVDRNVMLGTRELLNRWVVTLRTAPARDYLLKNPLCILNKKVSFRSYDQVLTEEYDEFRRYEKHMETLHAKPEYQMRGNKKAGEDDDQDGEEEGPKPEEVVTVMQKTQEEEEKERKKTEASEGDDSRPQTTTKSAIKRRSSTAKVPDSAASRGMTSAAGKTSVQAAA